MITVSHWREWRFRRGFAGTIIPFSVCFDIGNPYSCYIEIIVLNFGLLFTWYGKAENKRGL